MFEKLKDVRQFVRFFLVSVFGTLADYSLAVSLKSVFLAPSLLATTLGFLLGTMVNYCAHNVYSYTHTDRSTISAGGYVKYLMAVAVSLLVRLAAVMALEATTPFPYWLVLLMAIGASFMSSYVVATLWVFRRAT